MKKLLITSMVLFLAVVNVADTMQGKKDFVPVIAVQSGNNEVCSECSESGCIYQEIETVYNGTDMELEAAILEVCKRRGISDSATIELLRANYYL